MWEEDEWGYCEERDKIPNHDDGPGCVMSMLLMIGGFLMFAGIGYALFGIITAAGKYIIILFLIILAAIAIINLLNINLK